MQYKVIANQETFKCNNIDSVIECLNTLKIGGFNPAVFVNGIIMPDPEEDETFFYASALAAKNGEVWCEKIHAFVSKSWLSEFESDCFEWNEELVLDNVYKDIYEYDPVTGEKYQAIVRDEYIAYLCKKEGYDVLPCGNPNHILDDGSPDEWWIIFPDGGEDEYFHKVYA